MITTQVQLETGDFRRGMVKAAVEGLGDGFMQRLKEAKSIFLKVNLVHAEFPLACTHVDAVRGVLDVIRYHTQAPVFVGDASFSGTLEAFRVFGYGHLLDEYESVSLIDLHEDACIETVFVRADGLSIPIRRARTAVEADVKISLTPLKMDAKLGTALSVTNWTMGTWLVPSRISAGGRVWARWPWIGEEGSRDHHQLIVDLQKSHGFDVAVIDGLMGMEQGGPIEGTSVNTGFALAGFDPFAVDAVAATLMGVDPGDVGYLSLGADLELGVIDLGRIDVPPMLLSECTKQFARSFDFDERISMWKSSVSSQM